MTRDEAIAQLMGRRNRLESRQIDTWPRWSNHDYVALCILLRWAMGERETVAAEVPDVAQAVTPGEMAFVPSSDSVGPGGSGYACRIVRREGLAIVS